MTDPQADSLAHANGVSYTVNYGVGYTVYYDTMYPGNPGWSWHAWDGLGHEQRGFADSRESALREAKEWAIFYTRWVATGRALGRATGRRPKAKEARA